MALIDNFPENLHMNIFLGSLVLTILFLLLGNDTVRYIFIAMFGLLTLYLAYEIWFKKKKGVAGFDFGKLDKKISKGMQNLDEKFK